jgi:hypothetical protein
MCSIQTQLPAFAPWLCAVTGVKSGAGSFRQCTHGPSPGVYSLTLLSVVFSARNTAPQGCQALHTMLAAHDDGFHSKMAHLPIFAAANESSGHALSQLIACAQRNSRSGTFPILVDLATRRFLQENGCLRDLDVPVAWQTTLRSAHAPSWSKLMLRPSGTAVAAAAASSAGSMACSAFCVLGARPSSAPACWYPGNCSKTCEPSADGNSRWPALCC